MDESSAGSITRWIRDLKEGHHEAADNLWARYVRRLMRLANRRLGGFPRKAFDEEDVVASVFESLFRGVAEGRFLQLTDRRDLWLLLIAITKQKSSGAIRHETREKRGGGRVRDEQAIVSNQEGDKPLGLADILESDPTHENLVAIADELRFLLGILDNESYRDAAKMRLAGSSNEEIAVAMGRTVRTVGRWLLIVRETWEREFLRWQKER